MRCIVANLVDGGGNELAEVGSAMLYKLYCTNPCSPVIAIHYVV